MLFKRTCGPWVLVLDMALPMEFGHSEHLKIYESVSNELCQLVNILGTCAIFLWGIFLI